MKEANMKGVGLWSTGFCSVLSLFQRLQSAGFGINILRSIEMDDGLVLKQKTLFGEPLAEFRSVDNAFAFIKAGYTVIYGGEKVVKKCNRLMVKNRVVYDRAAQKLEKWDVSVNSSKK